MSARTREIALAGEPILDLLEAQNAVRAIWKDVLGDEAPQEIGADDDFFEIGGTSLSLVAVVTKMSEHFGADLPTGIVVNGATISALAKSALEEIASSGSS